MVNGFRYYRALESVSIASALSTALTIYPCQIRVHQRWQSKLQLPTARKEWWPATAGSWPHAVTCQHCDTHYFSRPRTRNLPIVGSKIISRLVSLGCLLSAEADHNITDLLQGKPGLELSGGGWGVDLPQFMSTDAHFWVKIGHKLQSLGKISNISAADPQFF